VLHGEMDVGEIKSHAEKNSQYSYGYIYRFSSYISALQEESLICDNMFT
jgi:hypothetical protein